MAKAVRTFRQKLLDAISDRLNEHCRASDISTSLREMEQSLVVLAAEQETEAKTRGSIARSLRLQTDAIGIVRKQIRATREELQSQASQVQQTLDAATAGRDGNRKVLNALRAQSRVAHEQLAPVFPALAELGARIDTIEAGQRRAMNFMRREGNVQAVLDRVQAAEKRLLVSVESGALTTASEVSEATARSVDAVREDIGHVNREFTALREQIARAEDSISGTHRSAENSVEGISELRGVLEELFVRSRGIEEALDVSIAPLELKLDGLLDGLVEMASASKSDPTPASLAAGGKAALRELARDVASINANLDTVLRLSDTVKNDVKALHRHVGRTGTETVRQTESLLQLLPRVDVSTRRYPASGGFAMNPDSLLLLADLIAHERPARILELGSGTSTVWIATFAATVGGSVVSIDHLEKYRTLTEQSLSEFGLGSTVEVRLAELAPAIIDGEERQWYDLGSLADLHDIDMVIVDGPPESTGVEPRYPAFPALREKLADRALIVVDDLHREQEVQMVANWIAQDSDLRRTQWNAGRTGVLEYVRLGSGRR